VRITLGGLEVWQNLGMARFAAMRRIPLLESLPRDVTPDRIQLVDLTGTGAVDLVVREARSVAVFPNGSGAAFGRKITFRTRGMGEQASMEVVDLLGTAAKGLLYTESAS